MTEAALHPADEYAYVNAELDRLAWRKNKLKEALIADREARVGLLHHVTIQRYDGRDVLFVERLPELAETLRLLSGQVLCVECETTGLHAGDGDRIVSLAVLQAMVCNLASFDSDRSPQWQHGEVVAMDTSRAYVDAFNPEGKASSPEALAVHGLSDERLAGCPTFAERASEVEDILTGRDEDFRATTVVAHNAPFDMGFLDEEFTRADRHPDWTAVVDTRLLSKMLWPGESGSLDALCNRLGVDRGDRDARHESLRDARLLALCLPGLVAEIRRRLA